MLEIKGLTKKYKDKLALDNFTYTFEKGVYGLLGPNGAGKSTLMNILVDGIKKSGGDIRYNGKNITKLGYKYRDIIGYVPQQQGMYDSFTAEEFLNYIANLKGINKKEISDKVTEMLEFVNLENVRKNVPLVHNITNYVTVNDVANVLLACGGSPIMSDDIDDVVDITSICGGLNINIGTLNTRTIESMVIAGKKANELHHPVVLDPVGVGASTLRTQTALKLLKEIQFSVIRGNISEIRTLMEGTGNTKGVDADLADAVTEENLDETIGKLKAFSEATGSVIAVTGAIDLVADSEKCYVIRNGKPEMGAITGTGCQLSGMMTAFLCANAEQPLEAAAAAVCAMGIAGEIGFEHLKEGEGNSTYRNRIIDAIYHMDGNTLEERAKYELR